jgi:hypothetical protein
MRVAQAAEADAGQLSSYDRFRELFCRFSHSPSPLEPEALHPDGRRAGSTDA